MRYFLDTEFNAEDEPSAPELISIGIVCEDGREFYAEDENAFGICTGYKWLEDNVRKNLLGKKCLNFRCIDDLEGVVSSFMKDCDEIWCWYGTYDFFLFMQIFGGFMTIPRHIPVYFNEIQQLHGGRGSERFPAMDGNLHNALDDAKWNMKAWEKLTKS